MFPLRLHSDFSLLRAMPSVERYVEALKEAGYPGAALTDFDAGFGWVDFYFKMKSKSLKPVLGTHLQLGLSESGRDKAGVSFIVLNQTGYENLSRLLSSYSFGSLRYADVLKASEGLVMLLSPEHSPDKLDYEGLRKAWPEENLFVELHRHEGASPEAQSEALAERLRAPLVATQPVFYLNPEDHTAHEVMMCIGTATTVSDESRPRLDSKDFFLRSRQEMMDRFQDRKDCVERSEEIAACVNFDFKTDTYHLPSFGSEADVDERFVKECFAGLEERLKLAEIQQPEKSPEELRKVYTERLHDECEIIKNMQFPGYFLIVADFIQWSKDHNIPVGPGRGSGAGSLAAYCLRITDIDPIRFNLLFERFLNPERVSMPDFDIDFCIKGRDQVIQYVRDKYNLNIDAPEEERLKVSQIVTYGKMKSKAVIRDVGRALALPYSDVDAIAKLVPNVLNITLQEAFDMEPEFAKLRSRDRKADELLRIAERLEGLNRHTSVHAAGVVIADDVLTKYVPLHSGSDEEIVCQFEMKAVEKIGLVKFDFLGLRNLTVIQECLQLIGEDIDLLKIDYNDPKVMELISTGETVGIFQLESSGMRDVIRRLQPTVFEDLIAIVALYRPGPLEGGMVDDFILRKRGQKPVTYSSDLLEPILKETYGVFVYQEQVMGTANIMAGFSLGEADMLRRAMGKKIAEEMAKQREKFVKGALAKNIDEDLAQRTFDLMSEFAKYGFNKSHAAAYAMITFQTAYLKTYYPEAFFAALLTSEAEDTDKVGSIIRTAQMRDLEVHPPHANHSMVDFSLEETESEKSVRFGLSAVKNLGVNVAKAIVEEREKNGPYKDYFDFFSRVPGSLLNKRQSECLIRAGVLDGLGATRSSLHGSLDKLLGNAQASEKARLAGQGSLFNSRPRLKKIEEWTDRIRLNDEKHLLGTYMTGHPLNAVRSILASFKTASIADLHSRPVPPREKEVGIAGLVSSKKEIITKKGNKMAFFTIEDLNSQIEIVMFSDLYAKKSEIVVNDRLVHVRGQVVRESGSTRILAREIADIAAVDFEELHIKMKSSDDLESQISELVKLGSQYNGDISLKVRLPVSKQVHGTDLKSSYVVIDTPLRVQTHPELIGWIETQFGQGCIELV